MFYPGSRILHEKWNANLLLSCSLCFQEQNLSHIQKDPGSEIRNQEKINPGPGSPIQGVKKHWISDPGSGSATLHNE
jgi:hypothetical protein